jgi:hypothetical protein
MLSSLLRAIGQLGDPAIRRVLALSVVASLLLVAALSGLLGGLLLHQPLFQNRWIDTALDLLGGVAILVLAWFLFPAVALAVAGLLLDDVIAAVERRWYPGRRPSSGPPLWVDIRSSLAMTGGSSWPTCWRCRSTCCCLARTSCCSTRSTVICSAASTLSSWPCAICRRRQRRSCDGGIA